jgi:hypothetical protein
MEGGTWFGHIEADSRFRVQSCGKRHPMVALSAGEPGELEYFDADGFVYRLDPRREEAR